VLTRLSTAVTAVALVAGIVLPASAAAAQDFASERRQMTEDIAALVRETRAEVGKEAFDERVMDVIGKVPRHEFVPARQVRYAYDNRPLPIGYGQTISQPYIVALMTDLARTEPGDRVLEVGTGSGYQAAVMAHLANSVYTIEIIEPLGKQAASAMRTCRCASATAITAGPSTRRTTRSSSPPQPATSRHRWCASSSPAVGW
jgi:protein-L-isoaspartate(D-aspartate) O-methyltransferase